MEMTPSQRPGLSALLRIEGAVVLVATLALFAHAQGSWVTFALAFLAPDLALAAYLLNPVAGAIAYNTTHSYVGAVALAGVGLVAVPAVLPFGLIWIAHIAWDRMLGYGLKSTCGFGHTHLGFVGRARS